MIGPPPTITAQAKAVRRTGGAVIDCRTVPLPDGPVRFTTYLKIAETGDYVALARGADSRQFDAARDIATKLPACG